MFKRRFKGEVIVEARRHPRIPLKIKLKYRILIQGETARLEVSHSLADDFGARGLAMRSSHVLKKGQLLTINLFIPPEEKRDEIKSPSQLKEEECIAINILARVAWFKTVGGDKYQVGVEFLDLEPKDRTILKHFLADYKLDDMNSPLYT